MKLAFDLFLLMVNLSQLRNKEKIIQLFTESLQEALTPAVIEYTEENCENIESLIDIRTRKSQFGFIRITEPGSIDKKSEVLINNAVQMLAIILEHLDFDQQLENERNSYAQIATDKTEDLNKTIQNLEEARSASINLVEDLSNEVKKRTLAEEAIRVTEARLKRAELASKSGNWELHLDTNKMSASEGANKIFGVIGDNFKYAVIKDIPLNEYRPMLDEALKNLVERNIPYNIDFKIKTADTGQVKDIHSIATFDPEKRTVFGIIQDISEHKQSEEALKKSEEQFKSLVKNMQVGVLLQNSQAEIILCNNTALELLGLSEDQLLGKSSFDPDWNVIHEDGSPFPGATHPVPQAIASRLPVHDVIMGVYSPANGTRLWLKVDAEPQINPDGTVRQVACTFVDITTRKNAEAEINNLNEQLEIRVLERTEQLEAANKELESFSYSASHDLRTPLRALDGFANILLQDYSATLDDEAKRMLNIIIANANKMGHLIDDLLSFSRIGKQEMELSEIDMHEMANSVFGELIAEKDRDKIQFRMQNLPMTYGDPALVRQVWLNLIANAIKFTSRKQDRLIEIGSKTENEENIFYVKDNGEGFEMTHSGSLFAVFKRLPTAKNFEGTGVGLAIVHRIVNRLGGRIWADGKVGEGATFYFALPAIAKKPCS